MTWMCPRATSPHLNTMSRQLYLSSTSRCSKATSFSDCTVHTFRLHWASHIVYLSGGADSSGRKGPARHGGVDCLVASIGAPRQALVARCPLLSIHPAAPPCHLQPWKLRECCGCCCRALVHSISCLGTTWPKCTRYRSLASSLKTWHDDHCKYGGRFMVATTCNQQAAIPRSQRMLDKLGFSSTSC
jgi:hypothetical protein